MPDASSLASVEEALFLGAVGGAAMDVVVSRPLRGEGGKELRPSPFWRRLGTEAPINAALPLGSDQERQLALTLGGTPPAAVQAGAEIERRRDAGLPGAHAGQLDGGLSVSARRWSPSQLHAAGACRFRWFAGRLLHVSEPLDPDQDDDRRVTGTLLHAALEGALAGDAGADSAEDPRHPGPRGPGPQDSGAAPQRRAAPRPAVARAARGAAPQCGAGGDQPGVRAARLGRRSSSRTAGTSRSLPARTPTR